MTATDACLLGDDALVKQTLIAPSGLYRGSGQSLEPVVFELVPISDNLSQPRTEV